MPDGGVPDEATIEDQLRQARQALSDAEGARDAGLSDAVVVNRPYYACFHAAQAAPYCCGHDPTTHGGDLTLFGSEIVEEGDASRADGRFLDDLGELRRQADYNYETLDEDANALPARTCRFVSETKSLCTSAD